MVLIRSSSALWVCNWFKDGFVLMTQYILHPPRPARHHNVRHRPEISVIPKVSQGLNTAVRNRHGAFLLLLPATPVRIWVTFLSQQILSCSHMTLFSYLWVWSPSHTHSDTDTHTQTQTLLLSWHEPAVAMPHLELSPYGLIIQSVIHSPNMAFHNLQSVWRRWQKAWTRARV